MDIPFGSVAPGWPAPIAAWLPTVAPLLNRPGVMQSMTPGAATAQFYRPQQGINSPSPIEPLGSDGPTSFGIGGPLAVAIPPAALFGPGFISSIPSVLTAVAIRRGQPMGPSNDQEIEDFVYDVFELLPGTADIEVRCEGGRATITGSVQHKRLKHDVGEIIWAIPAINDVQNNVSITTKRRARTGSRDVVEQQQPGGTSRKQT
jgi:hypothetical protein